MTTSAITSDERTSWTYAFLILLLVSAWTLLMRVMKSPFLMLDFEVSVVYLPTALAGILTTYLTLKTQLAQ
jgi:TRAP-type C4-dicarboxylate transport system permease small subunit